MNKKFIESIELIEKHWVLVTASLGVLTFIIERLFKAGAYIYKKAYFDFWEIPHVYINIDYRVVTFRFFETLIGVIIMLSIVCAGCLITQIAWKKVSPKGKFAKALFFLGGLGSILFVNTTLLYLLGIFYLHYTVVEIRVSIVSDIMGFFCCILMTFLCELGATAIGWPFAKWITREEELNREQKEEDPQKSLTARKKIQGSFLIVIVLIFAIGFVIESHLIYETGKDHANQANQLDIVAIEEETYIVVEQNDGVGILVPCSKDGEDLVIYVGEYKYSNLSGHTISRVALSRKVESYFDEKS